MAAVSHPHLGKLGTWNAVLMLGLPLVIKFKIHPQIEKQDTRDTQNACIQYMYVFIYMCVCVFVVCCILLYMYVSNAI